MCLALSITGLISFFTASSDAMIYLILGNKVVFYGILLGEFALVVVLSSKVEKMSTGAATVAFVIYSILNGLTLSVIFLVYTEASIATTFFITAGTFGIMSAYGYLTKRDLSGLGDFCLMGLIGLIMASLVNLFFNNQTVYWVTTYIGIIVFVGLTAYDVQKIKKMSVISVDGNYEDSKAAIMGALALYLDFINLFLYLLRIFGKRK